MKLADAKEGSRFVISGIEDENVSLQAMRFGIDEGATIHVQKNISGGPVIILRNQLELAIGREIASQIEVIPRG